MNVIHSCIEYIHVCTCLLLLLYVSKRECATWKTSRSLTFCTSRSFTCFVVDSLTQTYLNIIVLVCAWVCDGIRGETLSPPTKHDASLLYCFTTLITDVIVVDYPRFWPFHWCFLLTQPSTAKVKRNTLLLLMFCVLPYRIARTTTNEKVYGWYRPAIMVNGKVQRRTRRSKIENNLCTHTQTHIYIHT